MDKLKELIEVLSDEKVLERTPLSKSTQTCKICGEAAEDFHSAASKFEYLVSRICEECQAYYYGVIH